MVLEAVDKGGWRYEFQDEAAAAKFAHENGIERPRNFARAISARATHKHFCEGWQGLYNVKWFEKLDGEGNTTDYLHIWGVPRHSLKEFYQECKDKWPELPSIKAFGTALSGTKPIAGFRVSKLSTEATKMRLPFVAVALQVPLARELVGFCWESCMLHHCSGGRVRTTCADCFGMQSRFLLAVLLASLPWCAPQVCSLRPTCRRR